MLVLNHVHVAVSQQLPIDTHTLLQHHREHVRPVERDPGGPHDRPAVLVDFRLRSGDCQAGAVGDGQGHFFVLLLLCGKLRAPAPRARSAVVPFCLSLRRLCCHLRRHDFQASADTGRHLLRQLQGQGPACDLLPGLRRHGVLLRCLRHGLPVLDDLPGEGAYPAAVGTDRHPPRLVVLQVLQLDVVDPHIAVDPAPVVFGVADVHRHSVVRRVFIAGAPHLGLLLALVFHIHAVPAPDALLRGGLADDEPVHVLDAGVDAGLRGELLRMQHRHFLFAYRVVGPLPVVPGHQEAYAALDGDRPLRLVVDGLEGQAVQLAAQPVLDLVCQPLVLLPPRRHFGGGDGRRHLAFDVLEDDVPHVRRVLRAPVRLRVALHQRPQLPVSVVQVLPPVHALHLRLPGCVAVRQPLLPNIQFCRPDCRFSRFHRVLLSPRGTPEFQQELPPLGVRPVEVVPHSVLTNFAPLGPAGRRDLATLRCSSFPHRAGRGGGPTDMWAHLLGVPHSFSRSSRPWGSARL